MSNYLIVFRLFNSKSAINVFEMMQLYPSAAKIYKQYLVTLSLNDGLIEIRDITRNEGNVVYSMINTNAIGETLCVMYDKILYWERSQINILFVKFFDEQNDKTKYQIPENVKKTFDHHPTIKSRSIKESVVTIFFHNCICHLLAPTGALGMTMSVVRLFRDCLGLIFHLNDSPSIRAHSIINICTQKYYHIRYDH